MPNLENLRKQAKQILRWHRQRYFPVAPSIRESISRFREFSDVEIMESDFRLVDALEVVARQSGFESWQALIDGTETMNQANPETASKPRILFAEPQLFVSDLDASLRYYEKLGMTVNFAFGEPPFYAQVARDGGRLNLRLVPSLQLDFKRNDEEDLLSATLVVDDAKGLYLEFQEAGLEFHQRLRKEPWGAKTFILRDPDGNLILFAG